MLTRFTTNLRSRLVELHARRVGQSTDSGASTVEVLGWAAMSTVAIVAIGAALQALGVDLIDYVRTQLGL
jgi:hypothetical protein